MKQPRTVLLTAMMIAAGACSLVPVLGLAGSFPYPQDGGASQALANAASLVKPHVFLSAAPQVRGSDLFEVVRQPVKLPAQGKSRNKAHRELRACTRDTMACRSCGSIRRRPLLGAWRISSSAPGGLVNQIFGYVVSHAFGY